MNAAKRILLVGSGATSSLENSYVRAARSLGHEVFLFDPGAEVNKHIKLGKFGRVLHQFLPVEAWTRKMNRELVLKARDLKPDLMLVFTNVKVLYGTLATIKTIQDTKIAWVWPDTPLNLTDHNLDCSGLFDISAVYSSKARTVFEKIGFPNCHWVPLAGDPELHGFEPAAADSYKVDISFVGMWRPEREKVLAVIAEKFPQLNIEIYGTYWKDRCGNAALRKLWKGGGIVGRDLGGYFNRSRININVIDDTNYPAANMRFFEIPTAGGLQLSSPCPEQEMVFRDREEILYFNSDAELIEKIEWVLAHPKEAAHIRQQAHQKLMEGQTYAHRMQQILSLI